MKVKTPHTTSNSINRFEWLLRYWEAYYLQDDAAIACRLQLPHNVPWREFRKYLLGARPEHDFDPRFGKLLGNGTGGRYEFHLSSVAMALHSWTRFSRRVYHVEEDLQLLLGATEFGSLEWRDLHFPFDGFAVTLDQPLVVNNDSVDAFIFGRIKTTDGYPMWLLTAISSTMERFVQPFHETATIMHAAAMKGDTRTLRQCRREIDRIVAKGAPGKRETFCWGIPTLPLRPESRIRDILDEVRTPSENSGEFVSLFERIFRIVIGLPLYLKTLEGRSRTVQFNQPARQILLPSRNTISDESQVCQVSISRRLTPEHRQILRDYQRDPESFRRSEVGVHFRTGYWRRPPGTGHDPEAPKVVSVSPTIVMRNRLPDGSAPPGTENIV